MSIVPIGARILGLVYELEQKTKTGLILPGKPKEDYIIVKVEAIGELEKKTTYKKGSILVCTKYAGDAIEHEGQKYLLIKEEDVMAEII